jgi:antitoxin component of RelBE/YafQ-DinJ toxin-antitoxin module
MKVLFRGRLEKPLLEKANRVTNRLGTSTAEMFRIFVTQIARTGKVPLSLSPEGEGLLDRGRRNRVLNAL